MIIKTCPHCTKKYITEKSYSRACLPCWKRERYYDLSKADHALEMTQAYLTEVLDADQDSNRTYTDEEWCERLMTLQRELKVEKSHVLYLKGKLAEALREKTGINAFGITKSFVVKLLTLCHPDRHGGSDEDATEATKELLRIRKLLK